MEAQDILGLLPAPEIAVIPTDEKVETTPSSTAITRSTPSNDSTTEVAEPIDLKPFIKWGAVAIVLIIVILIFLKLRK